MKRLIFLGYLKITFACFHQAFMWRSGKKEKSISKLVIKGKDRKLSYFKIPATFETLVRARNSLRVTRRFWTVNHLHAIQLPDPLSHKVMTSRGERIGIWILLSSLEFVILRKCVGKKKSSIEHHSSLNHFRSSVQ